MGSIQAAQAGAEEPASSSGLGSSDDCSIYSSAAAPGVLLLPGLHKLAPERSNAWTRAVLGKLQPQHVLLLGAVQVSCAITCTPGTPSGRSHVINLEQSP